MDQQPYGCARRTVLGCLFIFVAMFACLASVVLVVDAGCYNSMVKKIPVYPGAQVVSIKYNLFRAFGMGETLALLNTSDSIDVVRNWYGRTVGAAYKAIQSGENDAFFFLADGRYTITDAVEGTGSQILLSGACGV